MKKNHTARSFALSSTTLHVCGLVLLGAGCAGSVIQRSLLGAGRAPGLQLLQALEDHPNGMALAGAALACEALEICAVPIFAFLLTEGTSRTAGYKSYFLRVLGLAAVCEIPYNLLLDGAVFSPGSLNPVFGVALSMIMLYFFRTYYEKKASHTAVRAVAIAGAFLWCNFLGAAFGGACVIITAVLWRLRRRQNLQLLCGCLASIACSVFSPLYLFSPIGFLAVHFYDGGRGGGAKRISYPGYPVILIACLLISCLAG